MKTLCFLLVLGLPLALGGQCGCHCSLDQGSFYLRTASKISRPCTDICQAAGNCALFPNFSQLDPSEAFDETRASCSFTSDFLQSWYFASEPTEADREEVSKVKNRLFAYAQKTKMFHCEGKTINWKCVGILGGILVVVIVCFCIGCSGWFKNNPPSQPSGIQPPRFPPPSLLIIRVQPDDRENPKTKINKQQDDKQKEDQNV